MAQKVSRKLSKLVLRFAVDGKTTTTTGTVIDVEGDSVCVHGDVVNAPEVLDGLHAALQREGIEVRSAVHAGHDTPLPLRRRASCVSDNNNAFCHSAKKGAGKFGFCHCEEPFDSAALCSGQAPRRSKLCSQQRLLRGVYTERSGRARNDKAVHFLYKKLYV